MKQLIRPLRPPRGRNVRRGLVQATFALGTVYLFFSSSLPLYSHSYLRQSEIAPLPWFGVIFYFLTIALHLTHDRRQHFLGRFVAGLTAVLFWLFAWTFVPTGLTAVAMYTVMGYWAAGEALFISDGC